MSDLSGMTRDNCGSACSESGCAITGLPRCCHPLKGGLPLSHLQDPEVMAAFGEACAAIGVGNVYTGEKAS
ncbi:hypothetical protein [Tardiphaga sp.]|uniref:hypothetical protein n=1 Tax=Tardiphaga sp. TaxID=1926292 RepID=UPI0026026A36|nr:hypothetical protein [Tardiphaga sp.]MDB5616597.1 hypothetical protein [Tardiphaga sp.]